MSHRECFLVHQPAAFQSGVLAVLQDWQHKTPAPDATVMYATAVTRPDGLPWTQVDVRPERRGDAVLHLPLEHPNMYLTNVYGAHRLVRARGGNPKRTFVVFGVCDIGTVQELAKQAVDSRMVRYHGRHSWDTDAMTAREFYTIFYDAARAIGVDISKRPVVTHCIAGMNRSSTAQLMFCILRAFNGEFGMRDGYDHPFGSGLDFDIDSLIAYHKTANKAARLEVLTNPRFVQLLRSAAKFERALHTTTRGLAHLLPKRRLNTRESDLLVAEAFHNYVVDGHKLLEPTKWAGPVPKWTGPVPGHMEPAAVVNYWENQQTKATLTAVPTPGKVPTLGKGPNSLPLPRLT